MSLDKAIKHGEVGGCDIDGDNDTRECIQEQCQWCWERDRVLAEYDKANPSRQGTRLVPRTLDGVVGSRKNKKG